MLIHSPRHTAEDLELWRDYEAADLAHGKTLMSKADRSMEAIEDFVATGGVYAGISWGKDSTVLAHLIYSTGLQVPQAWFRVEPIRSPECTDVRDNFLSRFAIDYHEIVRWCSRDAKGWHASGTLESAAKEAELTFGRRRILGIRADESGDRKMTCLVNGVSSANSCRPLAWWTSRDIMGYLATFDLPVHPAYAMLGGGRYDRDHLRVASIGGIRGRGIGRDEWEREYYGDVLRRLEQCRPLCPGQYDDENESWGAWPEELPAPPIGENPPESPPLEG